MSYKDRRIKYDKRCRYMSHAWQQITEKFDDLSKKLTITEDFIVNI